MRAAGRAAFTLVELMIAFVLGALVVALTFGLYTRLHRDYEAQIAIGETQESLSQLQTMMGRILRSAGGSDGRASLMGGRLWLPAGSTIAASDSPGGGSWGGLTDLNWGMGFRFVQDNWQSRSDVFDVAYFASGRSSEQGSSHYPGFLVDFVTPATWNGIDIAALPDTEKALAQSSLGTLESELCANAANRAYFVLTNGYHGCLVEISGTAFDCNLATLPTSVAFASGDMSAYCAPFQAPAIPVDYCATSGYRPHPTGGRSCRMIEFGRTLVEPAPVQTGPGRLRRYYVCGRAGMLASVPCYTPTLAATYTPTIPELHAISVDGYATARDTVVAMGVEDLQVSWRLNEYSGASGTGGPCPEANGQGAPFDTIDDASNYVSGNYQSRLAALVAGGTAEREYGCDDEERWIRRVALTLMTVTDAPHGTTDVTMVHNHAGLSGLNAAWPAAPSGGNYLRRVMRVEAFLRNVE
ncbi:MAG: hypothetical protein AABZ30_00445 [Myxococcota bacterium]